MASIMQIHSFRWNVTLRKSYLKHHQNILISAKNKSELKIIIS